jgi:CHAD domain-containing protein
MTIDPLEDHVDEGQDLGASPSGGAAPVVDDFFPDPTAGMVLHRVLAMAARTFLLNDMGDELADDDRRTGTVDALILSMGTRPLWAQSAVGSLQGTERRHDRTERIHQSRVAMRRIRSNLRTFRLLLDPAWGTALRAELAWYGNALGHSRDLDLLATLVDEHGPEVLDRTEVARLGAVIGWQRQEVERVLATEQAGPRRFHLTEQMMVLWEGPAFKAKAAKPASEVLPAMLHRSWRDLRGAARAARKDSSDAHLHQLRIRLKDLRYGAETVALVEGSPARKTAKAAERLQSKLGGLHDVVFSIAWLERLAGEQPELADAAARLVAAQRERGVEARKGWKRDLKDVERRWRRWQG